MALARSARAFLGLSERNLGVKQAALVSSTTSTTTTRDASFVSFLIKKSFFPTFAAKDGGEGKEENNATKSVLSKALDFAATVLDGKYLEAKVVHPLMNRGAQLVGEDYNGNQYFEIKKGVQYGRHRWVVYKDVHDYSPASVPPEWHGWLHNINDDAPSRVEFLEQSYKAPATTYEYLGYQPKGSYRVKLDQQRKKRIWKKYEAWTPPQ